MSAGPGSPRRSVQWLVWGGLVLTIIGIAVAFILSERFGKSNDALPIITQALPAFTLTNQLGQAITPRDLSNHVLVVNIVFTRCAGPCPEMTRRMSELQRDIPASLPVKLVTITTDPEFDTPEVLKRYSERFGANASRWWFLTGAKSDIARLAREGLALVALETKPEERQNDADLFIHSTVFVLLDKHGRLRVPIESAASDIETDVSGMHPAPVTKRDFNARVLQAVRRLARER